MLKVLEMVGIVLVGLTIYYLICTKFRKLGSSQAWIMIIASRILVVMQWACEAASRFLGALFVRSLRFPGFDNGEVFSGLAVLARLVYLVISLLIFGGELNNTLSAQSALWQTSTTVQLGGVEIASSALFLSTSAIWGSVLLEILKLIPTSCSLLVPIKHKGLRIAVGMVAGIFTMLSIVTIAWFYLWRAVFLLSPDSAASMTPWVLLCLGISTAASSILALWGLCLGSCALFSAVVCLLEKCFTVASYALSLIPKVLEVPTVEFSEGQRTTYEDYKPGAPWQVPNTRFGQAPSPRRVIVEPSKDDSETTQPFDTSLLDEEQHSSNTQEREVSTMPSMSSYVNLTLNDTLGERLIAPVVSELTMRGESKLVRSSGRVYRRNPQAVKPVGLGLDTSALTYETQENKIVEAFNPVSSLPSLHLHTIDASDDDSLHMVRNIARRLQNATQVIITQLAYADIAKPSMQAFLKELVKLQKDRVIATTFLIGTDSELAAVLGDITFHKYVAHVLVDLLIAPQSSVHNAGSVEVFTTLGQYAPFITFSSCSADTVSGKTPASHKLFSFATGNRAVYGDLDDLLSQASASTSKVVEQADTRAFPTESITPRYFITDVPLRITDRRFSEFELRHNQQAKQQYPPARTITISGNGLAPACGSPSPFRVGVTCLYELSTILPDVPQERDDKTRILQLVPLPASDTVVSSALNGNGHKNSTSRSLASSRTPRRPRKTSASATERK